MIAALLVVVVLSYRQTIFAYPNGGGSYLVRGTHTYAQAPASNPLTIASFAAVALVIANADIAAQRNVRRQRARAYGIEQLEHRISSCPSPT